MGRKEDRLSFRISSVVDNRINDAIRKSSGQIRDRSEFGTKAIKFYLDYIEHSQASREVMLEAISALATELKIKSSEIDRINEILKTRTLIPEMLPSKKSPKDHPDFDKLMKIHGNLEEDKRKKLYEQLQDATYEDISDLLEIWQDVYIESIK